MIENLTDTLKENKKDIVSLQRQKQLLHVEISEKEVKYILSIAVFFYNLLPII